MKALSFDGRNLELKDVPKPEPDEKEALVKVIKAGICATDIEITKGYMNFQGTLGHEFVGIVEECEELPSLVGKRVVGEINCGCGWCGWCREGLARHCPNRTVLGIVGRDGAFAEYLTLPAWNLHEVPQDVSTEAAVFTEPLAAAYEIFEQVHIESGSSILLIGDGRLAQLIGLALHRRGLVFDAAGKIPSKFRWLKGLAGVVYNSESPPKSAYKYVIDASGSSDGWETARASVEPRGCIILKSTYHKGFEFNPAPLVIDEVTVIGSCCGPFAPAIAAMADGLNPTHLIDHELSITMWEKAFELVGLSTTLKILFTLD